MAITTVTSVKAVLGITDIAKDTQITALIPMVEADFVQIRGRAFDVDDEATVYPGGAEFTAIKMINYHLDAGKKAGVSSESLGDHSISYSKSVMVDGYPPEIVGSIKRYLSWA